MLTVTPARLRSLSNDAPDALGEFIACTAFGMHPASQGRIHVEPREGWDRVPCGPMADEAYSGYSMAGYRAYGGGVIVTLVSMEGAVLCHIEGPGWGIESCGVNGEWLPSGDAAGSEALVEEDETAGDARDQENAAHIFNGSYLAIWQRDGYDWDAHRAADPTNSLARIDTLARPLGIDWKTTIGVDRPLDAMLSAIEARLGFDSDACSRMNIGTRITAAERAVGTR